MRRIGKLEADARRLQRGLDGHAVRGYPIRAATGQHREDLLARLRDVTAQIDYWKARVAAAEAGGVKVWGPADFVKGDYVTTASDPERGRWYQVQRVNKTSLTVPSGVNVQHLRVVTKDTVVSALDGPGWTQKLPYDAVTGRRPAAEIAAMNGAGELPAAATKALSEQHPASQLADAVTAPAGELSGDSPYQAAMAALDGYEATADEIARATESLEARLTMNGFDRDQALMGHVGALRKATEALQAHARDARVALTGRHAAGAEYHAAGRDASASAFRGTATEGARRGTAAEGPR